MNKALYHGSTHIIRKPELASARAYNDYGIGFYCTESLPHAAEWAVDRERNGFVSAYSLDCSGLRIIDLCSSQYSLLHWLYVLLMSRRFDPSASLHAAEEYISKEFAVDYQSGDCIIGYRADNCCFTLASNFLNGRISYRALSEAVRSEDMGRQFVLKSSRAIERILFTGFETVRSDSHYPGKVARELSFMKESAASKEGDLFINQMIEEDIKSYDSRIR